MSNRTAELAPLCGNCPCVVLGYIPTTITLGGIRLPPLCKILGFRPTIFHFWGY